MDIGKSFAWLLFLAVVAAAGSLGHHRDEPSSPPGIQSKAPVQLAGAQSATGALDSTHVLKTMTVSAAVK
jgi:hypothetical protein